MRYFSSDIHFGSTTILKREMRPFKSPEQFAKFFIKKVNKTAKKDDFIFVIGDFFNCNSPKNNSFLKSINYVKRIKAKVILICGNNEERIIHTFFNDNFQDFKKYCLEHDFYDVEKELDIKLGDRKIHLTHLPSNCQKDKINLFGHVHRAGGLYSPLGFNVGCDLNYYNLYSEKDIEFLISQKERYWNDDAELNLKYFKNF